MFVFDRFWSLLTDFNGIRGILEETYFDNFLEKHEKVIFQKNGGVEIES